MKITNAVIAAFAVVIPAVCALPTAPSARQFKPPVCDAPKCLTETPGLFNSCPPSDLACLCRLPQSDVTTYVDTVQPCIDASTCSDGAVFQYKDLLKTVCQGPEFGNKTVAFAPRPTTPSA